MLNRLADIHVVLTFTVGGNKHQKTKKTSNVIKVEKVFGGYIGFILWRPAYYWLSLTIIQSVGGKGQFEFCRVLSQNFEGLSLVSLD